MDDQKLRIFNAISSFTQDLNTGFGKKYKPVALYNRLVERTGIRNVTAVDRHIKAFQTFFTNNPNYVKEKTLTGDTKISYSERIFIDIGRITHKLDSAAQQHIHKHLITIFSLINLGTRDGVAALEALKRGPVETDLQLNLPDTPEGNFIQDTLAEMTGQFTDMNMGDNVNPMMMMSSMMQSGFFTKFMGDLQTKFKSGEMDLKSLMSTVTNVIGDAAPQGSAETEQIKEFVGQLTSTMTGGQGLPPEVQGSLDEVLGTVGRKKDTEPGSEDDLEIPEESEKDESN